MRDLWKNIIGGVTAPAIGAFPVVPHNTNTLARPIRGLTIGGGGTISYEYDGVVYTTNTLMPGTYSFRADKILATGTTANNMTGWV